MALTYTDNGGGAPDGSDLTFTYSFETIKTTSGSANAEVKVSLDGETQATTKYTVNSSPASITFNNTSIDTTKQESTGAPKSGIKVRVYRDTAVDTPDDLRHVFQAGSAIKASALNDLYEHGLFSLQERQEQGFTTEDLADGSVTSAKIANSTIATVDLADNSVTAPKIAADAVGSAQIADNAVTSSELASDSVGTTQIKDNAVTSANIAADAVGSAQIADGAVGASEIAANAVGSAQIADGAVGSSELAANSVGSAQIADSAVGSSEIAANAVGSAQIADSAVGASEIAANAVGSAQIADDAVGNSEIADDAVQNAQLADNSVAAANIAANAVGSAQIADGAVGSSELDANSVGNVQLKDNVVTMTEIGCEETTITDDDTKLPTSGAVVDYVTTQIGNIGGLKVIATEVAFPTTANQPASGVVISIADAGGIVFNGSGVSTTGRTTDGTPATVTISGAPASLYDETIAPGVGMQVSSTGSGNNYTYHKILATESDVKQLSDDINDFNSRYRIALNEAALTGTDDEGDLYFDKTANKMYVYDGSSWGQVTSTGEFKILGIKDNGEAHNGAGPTFNGTDKDQYDLFEGTADANITQAAQLTVVLNGVVQKPNDGTFSGSAEGFYLDGADGIKFCDPPPSGSTLFVIKSGSATDIGVPADNTVSAGKTDISLVQGDIIYSNGTDSWTRLAKGTAGQVLKVNSGATAPEWAADTNTQLTQEQVEDFVGGMLDGTETGISVSYDDTDGNIDFVVDDTTKLPLAGGTITGDVTFDNASHAGQDILWQGSNSHLWFKDSTKAVFGDGSDLTIACNGTGGSIYTTTGQLWIGSSGAYGLDCTYGNVVEFSTVAGGVKLWGHSEQFVNALGNTTGSTTIDFSVANIITATLTGATTFANPTTESVGQSGSIIVTQDNTGSRTLAWGTQFKWTGGTAPTLSTAANAVDRIDYLVVAADTIHCVASLDVK